MTGPDQKNMILAIVLSAIVLIGWQFFVGVPQMERQAALRKAEVAQQQAQPAQPGVAATPASGHAVTALASRDAAVEASPRVAIKTDRFYGSVNLKGGMIDDLSLVKFHETLAKDSANITVLSPPGTPYRAANHHDVLENHGPYFADFGWTQPVGGALSVPGLQTVWTAKSTGPLTPSTPLALEWDNGAGLVFSRTISVDDVQMFTVTDKVENKSAAPVSLTPYARISRIGTPTAGGNYILHEGLLGFIGDQSLHEMTYAKLAEEPVSDGALVRAKKFTPTSGGWIGFTEKYWASALVPDQAVAYTAEMRFEGEPKGDAATMAYSTRLSYEARAVAPGASSEIATRLFSGAKEVSVIDAYRGMKGGFPGLVNGVDTIKRFDLMIDWGWFSIFTYWLFRLLHRLYELFGNFGFAILAVTLILKLIFFPLANRSYASMAKMKKVQPQMAEIKEKFPDDKVKQQQAMMALYKVEKINPLSGCVPMLIQIPVFFALYKVLFVTIEMRQQPFIGWIHDLSAPDPTTVFNLFGVIPWTPPLFLMLGVWPLIMGVTMFIQMQLNPAPADPVQASMFRWMPVIFTFMLGSFPAGLVIYWAWNNTLSIVQQALIMRKYGTKIELWDNLKGLFVRKPKNSSGSA